MNKVITTPAMHKNFLVKLPTNSMFHASNLCYTINVSTFSHLHLGNQILSDVIRDVVHRVYRGVLYFQ